MFEAQTEWVKPDEFPDLRQADTIAIDLETHDPDLRSKGSGSIVGRMKRRKIRSRKRKRRDW